MIGAELLRNILASYLCNMHVGNSTGCHAGHQEVGAGVAPAVNLRNQLHAGEKACKQGIHPGFEIQGRHPKQAYQWPHKKDLCPPKKFF